jgi:hypothetical protein
MSDLTPKGLNRYQRIIEQIFRDHHRTGDREVEFTREELVRVAEELDIPLPKNLGDVIYSFRYRAALPEAIIATAPSGEEWIIRSVGRSLYRFVLVSTITLAPNPTYSETKVLDATPGIIARYALSDEQALLAKLRYNRLVDVFTGVTCYSLQSHLRSAVKGVGQVETDEIYIGVDRRGALFVFPVQAKGGNDRLSIVQIEQDFALCAAKFPRLLCRPIAAQFMKGEVIALFEFEQTDKGVRIAGERHYRLVPPDDLTDEDLRVYNSRSAAG